MVSGRRNRDPAGRASRRRHVLDLKELELDEEETAIVEVVRDFVDREVRPVVRDLEHTDTYPEKLIEQMKQLGIFGLAVPEPWGRGERERALLRGGDRGAGAGLDEPGRGDGWAHRRGQAARGLRQQGTAGPLPAQDGHRGGPGHDGAHRARRRVGPAGDADHGSPRRRAVRRQRRQDLDHQRAQVPAGGAAVPHGPRRRPAPCRHQRPARGEGARIRDLARPAQARVQGRGELRAVLRGLPGPHQHACSASTRERASPR